MSQDIILDTQLESNRNVVWWLYLIHGATFFFSAGLLSIIPVIVNYLKRDDTADTYLYSHHNWQIRSFWWYLFWVLVGAALFSTIIGIPLACLVWAGAWLWKAYRLIKGFLDLNDRKAMPA